METIGHEITLESFDPGRVLKIGKRAVLFRADMLPAIVMCNPKYPHNVGAAVRASSCFGARAVVFTGSRVEIPKSKETRLPREERMKGYSDVMIVNDEYPLNRFPYGTTPVAIEFRDKAEPLPEFVHPDNPVYVFGPEDGGISQSMLSLCHRFVRIPSKHCLNLGSAVNIVLYDRATKLGLDLLA